MKNGDCPATFLKGTNTMPNTNKRKPTVASLTANLLNGGADATDLERMRAFRRWWFKTHGERLSRKQAFDALYFIGGYLAAAISEQERSNSCVNAKGFTAP
jgi:hypothetical protein